MHIYNKIYEFAASAGAFEGYVYKRDFDIEHLSNWIEHIVEAYNALPEEVIEKIQESLDGTIGRAIKSLILVVGENHYLVVKLRSIVKGELPESPDDFNKKKWFE